MKHLRPVPKFSFLAIIVSFGLIVLIHGCYLIPPLASFAADFSFITSLILLPPGILAIIIYVRSMNKQDKQDAEKIDRRIKEMKVQELLNQAKTKAQNIQIVEDLRDIYNSGDKPSI